MRERRATPVNWGRALARIPLQLYRHGSLGFAKGAAYSALLSFFPVFSLVVAALIVADASALARRITALLYEFSPPEVEQLLRSWFAEQHKHRASLRVLAVTLSLWAASGLMMSLMEGFQAAYEKKHSRGIVRHRLIAIALVVCSLLPAVGATALVIAGDHAEKSVLQWLGMTGPESVLRPGVELAGRTVRYLVALVAVCSVTVMLYRFGAHIQAARRRLLPGAMLATGLWLALTQAFAWYVKNVANYRQLYGSIGAVIAFLVWMYLLALVAMAGCEFNAALDRSPEVRS
jgi:membrane protein